jgi:hypothetical protein
VAARFAFGWWHLPRLKLRPGLDPGSVAGSESARLLTAFTRALRQIANLSRRLVVPFRFVRIRGKLAGGEVIITTSPGANVEAV